MIGILMGLGLTATVFASAGIKTYRENLSDHVESGKAAKQEKLYYYSNGTMYFARTGQPCKFGEIYGHRVIFALTRQHQCRGVLVDCTEKAAEYYNKNYLGALTKFYDELKEKSEWITAVPIRYEASRCESYAAHPRFVWKDLKTGREMIIVNNQTEWLTARTHVVPYSRKILQQLPEKLANSFHTYSLASCFVDKETGNFIRPTDTARFITYKVMSDEKEWSLAQGYEKATDSAYSKKYGYTYNNYGLNTKRRNWDEIDLKDDSNYIFNRFSEISEKGDNTDYNGIPYDPEKFNRESDLIPKLFESCYDIKDGSIRSEIPFVNPDFSPVSKDQNLANIEFCGGDIITKDKLIHEWRDAWQLLHSSMSTASAYVV